MTPTPIIPPGAVLGILGGGQLGRMFCMEARRIIFGLSDLTEENGGILSVHLRLRLRFASFRAISR